jgi:predicted transposase YbfD/YdcC
MHTSHGRQENRHAMVWHQPALLAPIQAQGWPKLTTLICLHQTGTRNRKPFSHTRYFMSSVALSAPQAMHLVRQHWQIENNLHRVLDTVFLEDHTPTKNYNANCVLSLLRKLVLNCLRSTGSSSIQYAVQSLANRPTRCFSLLSSL